MLEANANRQMAGCGRRNGPSGMMVMPRVIQKNSAARKPRFPLYFVSSSGTSMRAV